MTAAMIVEPEQAARARRAVMKEKSRGADSSAPTDLPPELLPVPQFESALLPSPFKSYVEEFAENLDCAPELIAVPLLTSFGSVAGNTIGITPKRFDPWTVFPNVWGAVIGRSAAMKTPAANAGLAPIRKLQSAAREEFKKAKAEKAKQDWINKARREEAQKSAKAALKKGEAVDDFSFLEEEEEELVARQYSTNDSTLEALHKHLSEEPNTRGVLVENDELASLIGRMSDPRTGDQLRAFYLKGWNGNVPENLKRIGRGEIEVPRVCISVFGGIQPGKLAPIVNAAVRGASGDDGFIQRFGLMVWPDLKQDWKCVDLPSDGSSIDPVLRAFKYVDALEDGIRVSFDDEGRERFARWLEDWTKFRKGCPESLESHFGKYNSLVPQLALIIHLCEADEPEIQRVSIGSLEKALKWVDYLAEHAKRVYDGGSQNAVSTAKRIVEKLREGKIDLSEGFFNARSIYSKGWGGLKRESKDVINDALELLVDYGWLDLEERQNPGGGPKAKLFRPNPNL